MSEIAPVIKFYADEACTVPLKESKLAPGDAGETVIWDVYVRNEGKLRLEAWDIFVQAWYQVPRDWKDLAKGYDLAATTDCALMSTPRPKSLDAGQKAHLRVKWSPPASNYYPIEWKIAAGGPYIIGPFG